jgi:hypothetical protein
MKRIFLMTFLLSLFLVGCGPSTEQQSTLIAVSIFDTMTAEATRKVTPTPTYTETSTPIQTPTITNTPTPDLTTTALAELYQAATSQANWKPSLYDSFGLNVFEWCNSTDILTHDDGGKFQCHFLDGTYQLIFTSGDKYPQTYVSPQGFYYDFNVSVLAKLITGDPETAYGLVFRAYFQSLKGLTRFILSPANEYRIDTRDSNNNWIVLQDWTKTNDMKPQGEWNKLGVSGVGPVFSFFINDKFQTSVTYNGADAGKGTIGLVVNSDEPGKNIEVFFDDFTVREP